MAGTAGVGEEVRANRLDAALHSIGQLADSFEVLVGAPAGGQDRQRQGDDVRNGSHFCNISSLSMVGLEV